MIQRLPGLRALLWFWAAVIVSGGAGAAALQYLGRPALPAASAALPAASARISGPVQVSAPASPPPIPVSVPALAPPPIRLAEHDLPRHHGAALRIHRLCPVPERRFAAHATGHLARRRRELLVANSASVARRTENVDVAPDEVAEQAPPPARFRPERYGMGGYAPAGEGYPPPYSPRGYPMPYPGPYAGGYAGAYPAY